ncbi:20751_t:CDS:2 [Entrophospora sp. SA101]|nr:16109_t:CDS:2 [Entrophospora sp. SA101]CAJ0752377.1 20751_t:CDS:2 [Entrophospora sp. SA101]CAJ0839767.1 7064_t:CDS:2 [Entrophospora sp. SA101]
MRISTILIFTSLLLTTVKAGVFTTSPFSKTIWTAGATETITWKDDGKNPSIKTLNKLQIDLFNGNDTSIQTFVRNVANDVDANTRKFTYAVPSDVGPEGQYFLKYTQGTYVETSGVFQIINSANVSIPAAVV